MTLETRRRTAKVRHRKLRLELLETRSLLTAAPWADFDRPFLGPVLDVEWGLQEFRASDSEVVDGRGERSRRDHHPRDAGRGQPRGTSRFDAPPHIHDTSLGGGPARHGQPPQRQPQNFFDEIPLSYTEELIFLPNAFDSIQEPEPVSANLDLGLDLVVHIVPITFVVVFEPVPDARLSDPGSRSVTAESPSNERPPAVERAPSNTIAPRRESSALQRDPALPPSLQGDATPIVESADEVVFDAAQPRSLQAPEWRLSDARPQFQPAGGRFSLENDFHSGQRNSLDLALENLFPDDRQRENLEDLDELLDALAEENQSHADVPSPRPIETPAEISNQPRSVPRPHSPSTAGRLEEDGMIAMRLPDDLLLDQSRLLEEHDGDQSKAWTARVGLYRSHELAAANGGTAMASQPINAHRSRDLTVRESRTDELFVAHLRPVVAATSAAFGAIFLGLRSRQRKAKMQEDENEKLV